MNGKLSSLTSLAGLGETPAAAYLQRCRCTDSNVRAFLELDSAEPLALR